MAETSEMEDLVKNRSRQEDRRPLGDGVKFLTYEAKQKILKLAVGEMVSPLTLFFGAVLHKKRTIFVIQYFLFLSFFRPRFIMHVSYLLYYTKLTIELKCGTGCYIFLWLKLAGLYSKKNILKIRLRAFISLYQAFFHLSRNSFSLTPLTAPLDGKSLLNCSVCKNRVLNKLCE